MATMYYHLGGVVVERPRCVQDVAGSFPGRVIPNTIKMIVMGAVFEAQCCWVSITTDWLVSG